MQRVFQLALHGKGQVAPNPMVGCVIVHQGRILAEGWHQHYGQAHAEVNAISQVQEADYLRSSTLYVNLEPCAHYGKTPPCANLIVEKQLKQVVIANVDPNPLVAGKGIQLLKQAGIQVLVGIEEAKGKWLNRRFFTFMQAHRPYIILKWAQSSDGFIAPKHTQAYWLSSSLSRQMVHRWRSEESAVLIGKQTALQDNPQLTNRYWHGPHPLRIILAGKGDLPAHLHLFNTQAPSRIYAYQPCKHQLSPLHQWVCLPASLKETKQVLHFILNDLQQIGIQSLIVEGGPSILQQFLNTNLWDEIRLFIAPIRLQSGKSAPSIPTYASLYEHMFVDNDHLMLYINPHNHCHDAPDPAYS